MPLATASLQCGYIEQPMILVPSPLALLAPGGHINQTITLRLMSGSEEIYYTSVNSIPEIPPYNPGQPDTQLGSIAYTTLPQNRGYQITGTLNQSIQITLGVTTSDGTVHTTSVPITVTQEAGQGEQGIQGKAGPYTPPPMLWTDYPANFPFQSGAQGEDYRHCVIHGFAANGKALAWVCTRSHTKASTRAPATGSYYWKAVEGGPFTLISTDVILAAQAYIKCLSSNGIRIYDDTGENIAVQFTGGVWPILCGSTDPTQSPTRISSDGTFYSNKAIIEGDVIFGGQVRPQEIMITPDNYRKYWISERDYNGGDSYYSATLGMYDFRALTGHVTISLGMASVSSDTLLPLIVLASQYAGSRPNTPKVERYIGQRLHIVNRNTKSLSLTGLIVEKGASLAGGSSVSISQNQEIDLLCIIQNINGSRAIGWEIQYRGPVSTLDT